MKKHIITIILSLLCLSSYPQIKMHSNGQVSFQSTTTTGGIQIDASGKCSFEPNNSESFTSLTMSKAQSSLVKVWCIDYRTNPPTNPSNRFYVTGIGNVYSNGVYSIIPGNDNKGNYPIENASSR